MTRSTFSRPWIRAVLLGLLALLGLGPLGSPPVSAQPAQGTAIASIRSNRAPSADPGTIAYVRYSTHDIHVISPDGTGDRVLWTAPTPLSLYGPLDLAWRRDGRELAFSSDHEFACSWYESDVYAISVYGGGLRRVTNAPACAALAGLPKGSVTVNVNNWTSTPIWVYVEGAPGVKYVTCGACTVTFDNVADLGPGVLQPAIGIYGLYRILPGPPFADVQPNKTVAGGNLVIGQYSGIEYFGTGDLSWKADGSAIAYAMRTSGITQIAANPYYGVQGADLPVVQEANPSRVAWGPTPGTKDFYLYVSPYDILNEGVGGIYLNTVGDTTGGTQLVSVDRGESINDVEWLPDASGFVLSVRHVPLDIYSDIFRYDFGQPPSLTRLTTLNDETGDGGARGLSVSPDGQQIVFARAVFPNDSPGSLWIMNVDGSDMHKLADDAGRPAWGQTPAPLTHKVFLSVLMRGR